MTWNKNNYTFKDRLEPRKLKCIFFTMPATKRSSIKWQLSTGIWLSGTPYAEYHLRNFLSVRLAHFSPKYSFGIFIIKFHWRCRTFNSPTKSVECQIQFGSCSNREVEWLRKSLKLRKNSTKCAHPFRSVMSETIKTKNQ